MHGVLGDYRIWEGVTRELGARYRLTAISRRYHWPRLGTPATGEYTYERQAEDLATVLLQHDGRVHLVGHSYGAGVALLTALRHPERIRSLVLIEPPFGSVVPMSENRFKPELASRDSLVRVIRSDAAAGAHRRAAEALFDWVQGGVGGFRALPQRTRDQILENASTIGPTFATASTRVTCDDLRALDVPVLVVTGQTTRPWYELIAFHTSACVPLAERATVPRASHMVIVERPAATAAVLARFFDAH